MPTETVAEAVTTWFGAFVLEGERVMRSFPAPLDVPAFVERTRSRRSGQLTPEESALVGAFKGRQLRTRDRRLVAVGIVFDPLARGTVEPLNAAVGGEEFRRRLLSAAESSLQEAWDPSIHVQETVRAVTDLDAITNLLGERLVSWSGRDAPEIGPEETDEALRVADGAPIQTDTVHLPGADPELLAARRELATLYRSVKETRAVLEKALESAVPQRTPNLAALLGPSLAAKMLAQAGGLDRLARLPASTVQVLGAERAFFEHLRGRAPPPRHGLLFLHPQIQSASRIDRGRLARALAGKVAIAARLDAADRPLDPRLAQAFATRVTALRARPAGGGKRKSGRHPTSST